MKNFNSDCTQDGVDFEKAVISYEKDRNGATILGRNVNFPEIGIQVDLVVEIPLHNKSGDLVTTKTKYCQAKGGKPNKSRKPGARRTDSVKKAIADGFLLKSASPHCWYTVYFSERPKPGSSSDAMLTMAQSMGVIDEVCYVGYRG